MEKARAEERLMLLRRELKTLKEINHFGVLKVVEPFEESKKMVGFATERVSFR